MPVLQSTVAGVNTLTGTASDDLITGTADADSLYGLDGNDELYGDDGADLLQGGNGNDLLMGQSGDDTLDGGAGDDALFGGAGKDLYLFGRGSGHDYIDNASWGDDPLGTNHDRVRLGAGIGAQDVTLRREGFDLVLAIKDTGDSLCVSGYFNGDAQTGAVVDFEFANGTVWARFGVMAKLRADHPDDDYLFGTEGADSFSGLAGSDLLIGNGGNDTLDGGDGTDQLYGGEGNDLLHGGNGNDLLMGDAGDDTLDGGAGDDALFGGGGSNVYLFGRGSGQDSVDNFNWSEDPPGGNPDRVRLGAGIGVDDVQLQRQGDDLVLSIKNTDDRLTISCYLENDAQTRGMVDAIEFADGTVWTPATVLERLMAGTAGDDVLIGTAGDNRLSGLEGNDVLFGANGNDELYGGDGADLLQGGDGNDALLGQSGDDTLDGGAGNDDLLGCGGSDVYLFGRGSGQDAINNYSWADNPSGATLDRVRLGADIGVQDVALQRQGFDLVLSVKGTDDRLLISLYLEGNAQTNAVVDIEFADGTLWTRTEVLARLKADFPDDDYLFGTTGNDSLSGLAGSDLLVGDAGNDTLDGGDGADQLYGGEGNDLLRGGSGNDELLGDAGNDTLDGSAGDDAMIGCSGSDLYLFGRGSGQDYIDNASWDSDPVGVNPDRIRLGADVGVNDVQLQRQGDDLVLSIKNTDDRVLVFQYLVNDAQTTAAVEAIEFANGTVWTPATVLARLMAGTAGDDLLIGTAGANSISGLAGNDTIVAGGGNDTLNGGAGNDLLQGGDGADVLVGGGGADAMTGGAGNDVFRFASLSDLGLGASRDVLTDFTTGQDRIDLSLLDANAGVAGQQHFKLVAAADFGHAVGQVSYANGVLSFNTDLDTQAEYELQLVGSVPAQLAAADLLL